MGPRIWGTLPSGSILGLIGLTLAIYLLPLLLSPSIPLLDPDEGLHATISQEMLRTADYVTPQFVGQPFFDKPVLFFWMQALSLRVLGFNEAGVRLPGLLFGLLGAVATALLGAALFNRTTGLIAGSFQSTMILPFALAQAGGPDVMLVVWTTLALLFLWRSERAPTEARALFESGVAGACLGLAGLTKGLVGIALVSIAAMTTLLLQRRLTWKAIVRGAVALAVALLIAAPWYLAMERVHPGYLYYYFVERHVFAYIGTEQRHGDAVWWYYVPVLLSGAFPWIVYVPSALKERWMSKHHQMPWRSAFDLVALWLTSGLLFLTLAASKLPTYLLPVFPALAILTALPWSADVSHGDRPHAIASPALATHLVVASLLLPATLVAVQLRFASQPSMLLWVAAVLVGVGHSLPFAAWRAKRSAASLAMILTCFVVTFIILMGAVMPRVAETLSADDLARHFNQAGTVPAEVWVIDERIGSLVFYLTPELRDRLQPSTLQSLTLASAVDRLKDPAPGVVLAIRARSMAEAVRVLGLATLPYTAAGKYRLYSASALQDRPAALSGWTCD